MFYLKYHKYRIYSILENGYEPLMDKPRRKKIAYKLMSVSRKPVVNLKMGVTPMKNLRYKSAMTRRGLNVQ